MLQKQFCKIKCTKLWDHTYRQHEYHPFIADVITINVWNTLLEWRDSFYVKYNLVWWWNYNQLVYILENLEAK